MTAVGGAGLNICVPHDFHIETQTSNSHPCQGGALRGYSGHNDSQWVLKMDFVSLAAKEISPAAALSLHARDTAVSSSSVLQASTPLAACQPQNQEQDTGMIHTSVVGG